MTRRILVKDDFGGANLPIDATYPKMAVGSKQGKILFIDAYDSFSENIAALISQTLSVQVTMIHIDTLVEDLVGEPVTSTQHTIAVFLRQFDAVVLGPGPGNPEVIADVGLFSEIWKLPSKDIVPVLGICLGFQSLCSAYGGIIQRMPEPCHGHAKKIYHCGEDVFAGVREVIATSYNSLEVMLRDEAGFAHTNGAASVLSAVRPINFPQTSTCQKPWPDHAEFEPFPRSPNLKPLAWDEFGSLMSVKHLELPYWGLQFHPESCKSNSACQTIIKNWWDASMQWSTCMKPVTNIPRLPLPAGHIWSRPLTPIHTPAEPCEHADNQSRTSTLYEKMQALTATCAQSMKSQTLTIPLGGKNIADFCKGLSQDDLVMLESTRKGRYSIYSLPSPGDWRVEYSLEAFECTIFRPGRRKMRWKMKLRHVLDNIHGLVEHRKVGGGQESLPFWGGFIGFFSYEVGLESLNVRARRKTSAGLPDISLLWVERSIVIDHMSEEIHIQSIRNQDSAWLTETVAKLGSAESAAEGQAPWPRGLPLQKLLASTKFTLPDEEIYKQKIQACQSYLRSGDSYELCLTTEAQISMASSPDNSWLLYLNLRRHNPVPFSAMLRLGKTSVLSSSPEQFLSWDRSSGAIDMIPMKGTVAKSPSMTLARATEILASPKESAENLMIADLIRHDLYSTIGWTGSVQVVKLCEVVEHETVYQLVSHIRAIPPIPAPPPPTPSSTSSPSSAAAAAIADDRQRKIIHYGHKALRQALPPGSMTGAPKKRSCEILERLEQRRRGVYSGVLGYLDVGGGGAFSVCIRTAVSHADEDEDEDKAEAGRGGDGGGRQTWHVGAGGAVTVLSDVDAEWSEMKTKLESVLRAFRP